MKIGALSILLILVIIALASCQEAPPISETLPAEPAATEALTSPMTEAETPVAELETLRENNTPLPEAWPKDTAQATTYPVMAIEDSTAENTDCQVSLIYTELLQGDRLPVDIVLTVSGELHTDYTAYFRCEDEAGSTISIPVTTDHMGGLFFYADIPSDAVCGSYDLVVKAEAIGYEGVLSQAVTVGMRKKQEFSFVYRAEKIIYSTSEQFLIFDLAVINEGDPFILYDNDFVYNVSEGYLTKTENGMTVSYPLLFEHHTGYIYEVQYIEHGESSVWGYSVDISKAEPGIYDLVVSYGGSQQTFENVLKITE